MSNAEIQVKDFVKFMVVVAILYIGWYSSMKLSKSILIPFRISDDFYASCSRHVYFV